MDVPSTSRKRPRLLAGGISLIVLLALAVLLPLAFRGELAIEGTHTGYIACWVDRPTRLCVYYYDHGNWLWFRSSPAVTLASLDHPELAVVSFEAVPVGWGLFRQRMVLTIDVAARSPGRHEALSVTLTRGSLVNEVPLDHLLFDAREVTGEPAVSDLSLWVTSGRAGGDGENPSTRAWISSQRDVPLEVTIYADPSARGIDLETATITLEARNSGFIPVTLAVGETPNPAFFLFRPWLAVQAGAQRFVDQPGPLIVIRSPD